MSMAVVDGAKYGLSGDAARPAMPVATESVKGACCPAIVNAPCLSDCAVGSAASWKVTVRDWSGPTGGRTQASCSTVAQATPSTSMRVTVTPAGNE